MKLLSILLITMNSTDMIFHSTVIGASHLDTGKECQDYSATWQNRSGSIKIAAVSDGHGGEAYYNSALGARLACKITIEVLKAFAAAVRNSSETDMRDAVKTICGSIVARWNETVELLRGRDPVMSFGCTLIAYVQTPEYWVGLQIGDGKFVIRDNEGVWKQPVPWDDRCILNFTTSLCDESAVDEFRYALGTSTPRAVFLSSDGIDSTFEDGELLYNFYSQIITAVSKDGAEAMQSQLPEALSHFSKVGSRDDMSLAMIFNMI